MPDAQPSHSTRQPFRYQMHQMSFPAGPWNTAGPWLLGALAASVPSSDVSSTQSRASRVSCPSDQQVTVQYMQDNGAVIPMRVHTIVISVQHNEDITLEDMRKALQEQVIRAVVPAKYLDKDTIYHLQPSGRFVIGGPQVRPGLWMRPWFVCYWGAPSRSTDCRGLCDSARSGLGQL